MDSLLLSIKRTFSNCIKFLRRGFKNVPIVKKERIILKKIIKYKYLNQKPR